MWLLWLLTPKTKLVIAIVDKTVLTTEGQEHSSLNWLLNQKKLTKTSKDAYKISNDYFGFFPKEKFQYRIKGLERFTANQLLQLSKDADMAYFTDTYGIYKKEWYQEKSGERSSGMLYGGLSNQDIEFLRLMKDKKKLVLSEFNVLGSPTSMENRTKFEKMFGLHWTGWTARYFNSLDTLKNKELPEWVVKNYKAANQNKWSFKHAGLVFVSSEDKVVILEESTHMSDAMPYIVSAASTQEKFNVPEKMKYPFWFDVIVPNLDSNQVVSKFNMELNQNGKAELKKYGIPNSFPAVISSKHHDYPFYYFSGDFCDNPISMTTSYFKGVSLFKFLFYDISDPMERTSFFWNFYRPMMDVILEEAKEKVKK